MEDPVTPKGKYNLEQRVLGNRQAANDLLDWFLLVGSVFAADTQPLDTHKYYFLAQTSLTCYNLENHSGWFPTPKSYTARIFGSIPEFSILGPEHQSSFMVKMTLSVCSEILVLASGFGISILKKRHQCHQILAELLQIVSVREEQLCLLAIAVSCAA